MRKIFGKKSRIKKNSFSIENRLCVEVIGNLRQYNYVLLTLPQFVCEGHGEAITSFGNNFYREISLYDHPSQVCDKWLVKNAIFPSKSYILMPYGAVPILIDSSVWESVVQFSSEDSRKKSLSPHSEINSLKRHRTRATIV